MSATLLITSSVITAAISGVAAMGGAACYCGYKRKSKRTKEGQNMSRTMNLNIKAMAKNLQKAALNGLKALKTPVQDQQLLHNVLGASWTGLEKYDVNLLQYEAFAEPVLVSLPAVAETMFDESGILDITQQEKLEHRVSQRAPRKALLRENPGVTPFPDFVEESLHAILAEGREALNCVRRTNPN